MDKLAGLSVLLVEDEYLIALDAAEILKHLGVGKVEIAATLDRAAEHAQAGQFDLAVLDVNTSSPSRLPRPWEHAAYPSSSPAVTNCAIALCLASRVACP
jgi:hypothetical protein